MVGTSFPYMEFYPKHDACRGVQIDRDPSRIGLRFPVEVGLCGDAKATLQLLLPRIRRRERSLVSREGANRHEGLARADAHALGRATTCR